MLVPTRDDVPSWEDNVAKFSWIGWAICKLGFHVVWQRSQASPTSLVHAICTQQHWSFEHEVMSGQNAAKLKS